AGARGDRRGSAERASVRLSLAARRPVENSALGPGRIRVVVQAAGGGRVQAAARRGCGAGSGAAGQRAGDDPGRDRCVEAEAPAALRAWRTINAPRAETLRGEKIPTEKTAMCLTIFVLLRLILCACLWPIFRPLAGRPRDAK